MAAHAAEDFIFSILVVVVIAVEQTKIIKSMGKADQSLQQIPVVPQLKGEYFFHWAKVNL